MSSKKSSISSINSVANLLAKGYTAEGGRSESSPDETTQRGAISFVRRGPAIPIEQTEAFKALPRREQRQLLHSDARHIRQQGKVIDEVVVPYTATLTFGRPRRRRAGELV